VDVVSLFVSWSLPSNGYTRYNTNSNLLLSYSERSGKIQLAKIFNLEFNSIQILLIKNPFTKSTVSYIVHTKCNLWEGNKKFLLNYEFQISSTHTFQQAGVKSAEQSPLGLM
jgi:hypothetical protein